MLIVVSMIIILEQTLSELAYPFKEFMDKPLSKPKNVIPVTPDEEDSETVYNNFNITPTPEISSSSISLQTSEDTYESTDENPLYESIDISKEPKIVEPEIIQPLVKESTILSMAKKVKENKQHALVVEELEENKLLLDQIDRGVSEKPKNFKLPSTEFLQHPPKKQNVVDENELDDKIRDLIEKLAHFNIDGDVVRTYAGPVVSTFEFKPAANIKVSKILGLQDDLAMALRAQTIRIQAPIPGKDVVGIEIPNKTVETIYLRDIFESKLFQEASSPLTLVLGKDIVGKPFITDLKKLPHLLIAGTTGSGKSVGINAMILSLLYKNS
ncbi:MAG: cell division protein FtsK, partial [Sulfuricurvum sp. 24-42-5]